MSADDQQLIDRIRQRDAEALGTYLERCRPALLSFIQRNMTAGLRAKVEAEDILQEVGASLVQSLPQVDLSEHQPFSWFCQVAKRRIVDAHRHFGAEKRSGGREVRMHGGAADDSASPGLVNLLVASITSPTRALSRKRREQVMLDALGRLPADQQQVLRLRYVDGLPSKEIAERIGKTDGATRVMLTRALQRLESQLGDIELTGN